MRKLAQVRKLLGMHAVLSNIPIEYNILDPEISVGNTPVKIVLLVIMLTVKEYWKSYMYRIKSYTIIKYLGIKIL